MYRELYRFGGVTFALESDAPLERSPVCEAFHVPDGVPDHTICLRFSDALPTPPADALRRDDVFRWQAGAQRHLLQWVSAPGDIPHFTYAVTHGAHTDPEVGRFVNADDTDVIFASAYRTGASVSTALEAVGLFDVFAARGMLVLHSAYIVTSAGEAILFSGPSGVGKSTQAALWERCAGARVVNGDRALVDVGKKTANGIFYAGTSGISENVTAPVRAIVN